MKKVLVCIMLLVVLAGCIKVQDEDGTGNDGKSADIEVGETVEDEGLPEEPKAKSYTLKEETKALVESQMGAGSNVVFPQNFQRISYGDAYVFGLGVNNMQTYEDEFKVEVNFDKAYDKYMNDIEVDEVTMNTWVKTVFDNFHLGSYKSNVMGIAMEVGYMKSGVKPQSGTYVFEIEVFHRISPGAGLVNTPYGAKQKVSIKVD